MFFTDDVAKELYRRGATMSDLDEISQIVVNYPRTGFVDTGDLHGDYCFSFVRDHAARHVWVMTCDEKERMDADDLQYFSKVNVAAALFRVQMLDSRNGRAGDNRA